MRLRPFTVAVLFPLVLMSGCHFAISDPLEMLRANQEKYGA